MPSSPVSPGSRHQNDLARALDLAETAFPFASPNPSVGCVLTRGDQVLGEGAHFYDRLDHAEIAALKAAQSVGNDVHGATAYVTLEPCSHHGRTGPCADALIAAGITHCVVATGDPNPEVRGQGIGKLQAAGVHVEVLAPTAALAQRARRLNDAFAFAIQHGRPFVTLKSAVSLDGKVAPPPHVRASGAPFWLTGTAARADVQQQRHTADAVLTGVGTVLADNPQLTDRTGEARRRPLLRVVLDPQLRTPSNSALVQGAHGDLLLVCDANPDPHHRRELEAFPLEILEVSGIRSPAGLRSLLTLLGKRQIRSVLMEAGPVLNTAMLEADLIDRVVLFYADVELGAGAVPFAADGCTPYLLQQRFADLQRVPFPHGVVDDIRVSGYLHDPWADF